MIQTMYYRKSQNNPKTPAFKGFGDISYAIQSNTILNRAMLSAVGFTIPYALNANNETEGKERFFRSVLYMLIAFASPD